MPTSDESWSAKARIVGDLERPDHYHLGSEDSCAFFGEYTARAGWQHSSTNQLIHNLKKRPSTRGTPQWDWKLRAIEDVGRVIAANILPGTLMVPIPPSKPPGSPEYDDRMLQVARAIGSKVAVREILRTRAERAAMHANQCRRDPETLRATLDLRRDLLS